MSKSLYGGKILIIFSFLSIFIHLVPKHNLIETIKSYDVI